MKKQYKIQLPKGKKVTMTNVDFENGVMTVNVELENDFHKAMHDEVCGVFGKINSQMKEVLKTNGITREKIEEMAKESIKELEKDCPDIWNRCMEEIFKRSHKSCEKVADAMDELNKAMDEAQKELNQEQKYEPKDGDFISFGTGLISIFKNTEKYWFNNYATLCGDWLTLFKEGWVGKNIRPATEEEKKLLIDKLAEKGKKWNPETKRIEDVRWRANDGDHYYYLLFGDTDLLVTETTDIRTHNDYERYNRGNYFKNREAAEKTSEQIREIFKNSKEE